MMRLRRIRQRHALTGSRTTCTYERLTYQVGESFPAADGCNDCSCTEGGTVVCTQRACNNTACNQPFEVGMCEAAIPVYWHNPQLGRCEPQTYGGCGGNENRYATRAECEEACNVMRAPGTACLVDGIVYEDGATVPDPFSCNSCTCEDGEISICTEIGCGEVCGDGTTEASMCAECGPAGGCAVRETGCLAVCRDDDGCTDAAHPFCDVQFGVCVNTPGCF